MRNLPEVLSIDEFKGNSGEKKYQCILTDPKNKKVLDILHGREKHIMSDYFRKFNYRDKVKYFVMDMWQPYKDIAEIYLRTQQLSLINFTSYDRCYGLLRGYEKMSKRNLPGSEEDILKEVGHFFLKEDTI